MLNHYLYPAMVKKCYSTYTAHPQSNMGGENLNKMNFRKDTSSERRISAKNLFVMIEANLSTYR